jgi:hypothetical protein
MFMSQPYAQDILACVGIIVTLVYVILTYRLLRSAEGSGKQTAQLAQTNKALVEVMQGQLQTMRQQHQFALDTHGAKAQLEAQDRVDAFHTIDGKLEVLRAVTSNLEELEAQLISLPQMWKENAPEAYDALGMADEFRYAPRSLITWAKSCMDTLDRYVARLKPKTQVFMLRPDELERWVEAKHNLLQAIRDMFAEAPSEAPQRYRNTQALAHEDATE